MKIPLTCMLCFKEAGTPPNEFVEVELRSDHIYEATCSKGHTFATILQEQSFEVLFDIGAIAIVDGYTHEGVSTIATSLEKFYEFYIEVIATKCDIKASDFGQTWKHLSRHSERQLGAFCLCYLLENKKSTKLIPNKWIEFRNKIIHKGDIPSREKAIEYGEVVMKFMIDCIRELRETAGEALQKVIVSRVIEKSAKAQERGMKISTMTIPTIVSLSLKEELLYERSFSKEVEALSQGRGWRPYRR